jgi:hypothetical protein
MKPFVTVCLIGLASALLLVGALSGTLVRHLVQILPILLVLALLHGRPSWGAYAALSIFIFWTGIVILIWLFLLGFSRVANGQYTAPEIVLTFVMAGCSISGVLRSVPLGRTVPVLGRIAVFILFAVLQVAAMWASSLRPIANR